VLRIVSQGVTSRLSQILFLSVQYFDLFFSRRANGSPFYDFVAAGAFGQMNLSVPCAPMILVLASRPTLVIFQLGITKAT